MSVRLHRHYIMRSRRRTVWFIARMSSYRTFTALLVLTAGLLSGCNTVLLHPSGTVAAQPGHLTVQTTVLIPRIVIPVIALSVIFAWRFIDS
jgi:hypothetical protein